MHNTLLPPHELDTFEMITRLQADRDVSKAQEHSIFQSIYQDPQVWVSSPCMEYAKNPAHHELFTQMLHAPPSVFSVIVELIKDHNVFCNNSNVPQTPVDYQLAVMLYWMGGFWKCCILGRYCL
jgi:hypothetical protein